jgi:hypothetical protein
MEFSLCTIYKNEEKNLEKFISHHIDLVGESINRLKLSGCITDIPIYHLGWPGAARTDEEKLRLRFRLTKQFPGVKQLPPQFPPDLAKELLQIIWNRE